MDVHGLPEFQICNCLIFSIPKILRKYFLYDRKLLTKLSRSAWLVLKLFLMEAVPEKDPLWGAVIAIQTFGDFWGFNPHCHILCTAGCFYGNGMFRITSVFDVKKLEKLFQNQILKMLLTKGKITKDLIAMLLNWRHSGFNVFCSSRIQSGDEEAIASGS